MRRSLRACYLPSVLVVIAACGGKSGTGPTEASTSPTSVAPSQATSRAETVASPASVAPAEPSSEPAHTDDPAEGDGESEQAQIARHDLRERLRSNCHTYLTSADVKKVCGRQVRIVDLDELGGPPDEWPPACVRTAPYDKAARTPLRLTIKNDDPDPRALVAELANDSGVRARSVDVGDHATVETVSSDDGVERVVWVAVGPMLVSLYATGPSAKAVPCNETQLVTLARRIVARLPR